MNMFSVKYVQDISFSQLNLAEQTDVKNLGRATPDLVVSHHQADYRLVSQNLTLLYTLDVGVLSDCVERNTQLGLLIKHIIHLALALP